MKWRWKASRRTRTAIALLVLGLFSVAGALAERIRPVRPQADIPIVPGETRSGLSITAPSYLNTLTFDGNQNDRIIVAAVTVSGTLDTTIYLYPPGGGPAEATGWTTGYGGDTLDHQLQNTGTYTLVIQDHGLNDPGTYNLTFLKLPGTVTSASDPDGGPVFSGATLIGKTINTASDLDAFQFDAQVNERIVVYAVTMSGELDTTIYLYPPDGGPAEASGWTTGFGGDSLEHELPL